MGKPLESVSERPVVFCPSQSSHFSGVEKIARDGARLARVVVGEAPGQAVGREAPVLCIKNLNIPEWPGHAPIIGYLVCFPTEPVLVIPYR